MGFLKISNIYVHICIGYIKEAHGSAKVVCENLKLKKSNRFSEQGTNVLACTEAIRFFVTIIT